MSQSAELKAQRRVTTAFIAAKPISVALIPVKRTVTQAGGRTMTPQPPRPIQTMRLIDQSSEVVGNNPGILRVADGQARQVTHQLIGQWDAAMAVGDYWDDTDGTRYEVMEMLPDNGYERRGKVEHHGG